MPNLHVRRSLHARAVACHASSWGKSRWCPVREMKKLYLNWWGSSLWLQGVQHCLLYFIRTLADSTRHKRNVNVKSYFPIISNSFLISIKCFSAFAFTDCIKSFKLVYVFTTVIFLLFEKLLGTFAIGNLR